MADEIWDHQKHTKKKYENYIKEKRENGTLAAFKAKPKTESDEGIKGA